MSMLRLLWPPYRRQLIPRTGLLHVAAQGDHLGENLPLHITRRLLHLFQLASEAIKPPRI